MDYVQKVCPHTYLRRTDIAVVCAVCSMHWAYTDDNVWQGTFERSEFEKGKQVINSTMTIMRTPTYEGL